jgi:putative ABC transport system permease protein
MEKSWPMRVGMRRMRSEVLGRAVRTAVRNPGRTLLTILGLAIGVGAFLAMVSFGSGARGSVLQQFEALGTRLLRVQSNVGRIDVGDRAPKPLTDADVLALRRDGTVFERVIPTVSQVHHINTATATYSTHVMGETPGFVDVHDWPLLVGGMFDQTDLQQRAKVAVLGATVVRKLFGATDPLGQTINIGDSLPCRVIGVLLSKGQTPGGRDLDDIVLIPVTTFQAFLGMPQGYEEIHIQVRSRDMLDAAIAEARSIVRRSHALSNGQPDDFRISSPAQSARVANYVSQILTGLLMAIASVSLLVGGIGVMNIQLVSVAERTKEIGIRSAIGASPRQILVQFLAEAVVLSLTGSLLGVGLGWIASSLVAEAMAWSGNLSFLTILGATLFGTSVGVAFGYLPARRAAQLEPIDALRHE